MPQHEPQVDVELGLPTSAALLEGYPTFTNFIARDCDAAIYRKFEELSARSLLYQQSELHDLAGQLRDLDHKDAKDINNENAQKTARYWKHFSGAEDEMTRQRRNLQEKIRHKIKEYRKDAGFKSWPETKLIKVVYR